MKKRTALISTMLTLAVIGIFYGCTNSRDSQNPQSQTPTAEVSMLEESQNDGLESEYSETTTQAGNSSNRSDTTTSTYITFSESTTCTPSIVSTATTKYSETNVHENNTSNSTSVNSDNVITAAPSTKQTVSNNTGTKSTSSNSTKNTTKTTTTKKTTSTSKSTTSKTTQTKATTTSTSISKPVATAPSLSPVDLNHEIFGGYYDQATQILSEMTMEEKVSQMFLVSYPGYSTALNQASSVAPGGYVLFAADFKNQTKNSIRKQLNTLKGKSKYGLFLGADEEGGGVVRVSMYSAFRSTRFLSPQKLFKQGGLQAIFDEAAEKAELLKDIGLNYNLAPVVDMPKNSNSYIYGRTLGQDAQTTAEFSAGVVNVMNSYGMMATLKHFPGYGDNLDTHSVTSVDTRSKETFENEDFLPFISGIQAGVPMIMVNHNIINCMDSTKPASLSPEVHRVLREELGFSGIIMTDGLTMGAIQKYASNGEAAVQAVLCGNDMIATTDYLNQKKQVLRAVNDGRIPEIMVNDAVRRILACKLYYGVL